MAVQVDYRIAPSDQFSVYNPDTKLNKTITYFTLLAKIRGDLNLSGASGGGDITGSGEYNYVAKFDGEKSITKSQIYDSGINVGIGNFAPAHKLDVSGGTYSDYFQLDTSYSDGNTAGRFSWNPDRETAELGLDGTVSLILGQDILWYVKNQSGSSIPKGRAVRATGALGASSRITVEPMVADGTISPKYLLGITIEEIENGGDGFVISQGKIRGIDTSGYTVAGTVLYCDPANAGQFTETEPTAPDLKLPIAFTVDSKSNGTLAVRVTAGTTIAEANDVQLTSVSNGQFLRYNSTTGAWENQTVTFGTVTNIATTAPITGGPITTTGTIGITQSGTSTDGYLSSTDWNTFNNKASASGTTNQIAKFTGANALGDSSISDVGTAGTTISINSSGTASFNNEIIGKSYLFIQSDEFESQIVITDAPPISSSVWRMGIDSASGNYLAISTGGLPPYDNHVVISRVDNGRLGIKTTAPTKTLHVGGDALIENDATFQEAIQLEGGFRPDAKTITSSSGSSNTAAAQSHIIFNDWTGGAGTGTVYLPSIYGYGTYNPIFRFLASANVSASNIIRIYPNAADTGTNINGLAYVELAAAYAVVSVIGIAGQWYILDSR